MSPATNRSNVSASNALVVTFALLHQEEVRLGEIDRFYADDVLIAVEGGVVRANVDAVDSLFGGGQGVEGVVQANFLQGVVGGTATFHLDGAAVTGCYFWVVFGITAKLVDGIVPVQSTPEAEGGVGGYLLGITGYGDGGLQYRG